MSGGLISGHTALPRLLCSLRCESAIPSPRSQLTGGAKGGQIRAVFDGEFRVIRIRTIFLVDWADFAGITDRDCFGKAFSNAGR